MKDWNAPRVNAIDLWKMDSDEFNKWRDENDFPRILDYFKKGFFHFTTWQKSFDISDEELIYFGISKLISRDKKGYIIKTVNSQKEDYKYVSDIEYRVGAEYGDLPDYIYKVVSCKEFISYYEWTKIKNYPVSPLSINSVSAYASPEYSHSYCDNLGLLKLGGIPGIFRYEMGWRKLQFVDLDFLNFEGEIMGSKEAKIRDSTARHWNISNAEMHFYYFKNTKLDEWIIKDSVIDRFIFKDCSGYDSKIKNSIMLRSVFGKGGFIPYFDNVDLRDSDITDDYITGKGGSSELMKRMKNAFVSHGQSSKAGKFYYYEKILESRATYAQFRHHFRNIPKISKNHLAKRKILKYYLPFYHLKEAFKNLSEYLLSKFQNYYWGYGEKPIRIIFISAICLLIGSVCLYFNDSNPKHNFGDSIYFSIMSFVSMNDAYFPLNGTTRIIVAALALLGLVNVGMLIAGFASKTRF